MKGAAVYFTTLAHGHQFERPVIGTIVVVAPKAVLLGHQSEVAVGRSGFVDFEGRPGIADPAERFERFRAAGVKLLA